MDRRLLCLASLFCALCLGCEDQMEETVPSQLNDQQRDVGVALGGQTLSGDGAVEGGAQSEEVASGTQQSGAEDNAGSSDMPIQTSGEMDTSSDDMSVPTMAEGDLGQGFGDSEPASVLCGEESCDLSSSTCCLREFGASCVDGADTPCELGGTPLICDGPEDCLGGQCCLGVGLPGELSCSPTPCVNLTLCHQDEDCLEDQVCRRCQFTGLTLAVCSRPNILPNLALSCE